MQRQNEYGERMCVCGHPWRQHVGTVCYGNNGLCECSAPADPTEEKE